LGYEVTGEIRNLPDGRVELIIEGMSEELLDFAQAVRDSGLGSLIRDEQRIWSDATGLYRGFAIVG
jgi:acylphosphatase